MLNELIMKPKGRALDKILLLAGCLLFSLTGAHAAGRLYGWGYLRGSLDSASAPALVNIEGLPPGVSIAQIAAGSQHVLGLGTDGVLYGWGANYYGQLGNGTLTDSSTPVAIDTSGVLAGRVIVAIAAGNAFSLALASDGQLFSWGYNSNGELGNGTTTDSRVPVAVDMSGALAGKNVKALAVGSAHSLVLMSDDRLYSWGANTLGMLGNSSTENSSVPVAVVMSGALLDKTVTSIAAGGTHNLVLTSDNLLYSWGANESGQCGDGTKITRTSPVAVDMSGVLSNQGILAITAGRLHCSVLAANGRVYGWGNNVEGELGNGSNQFENLVPAGPATGAVTDRQIVAIASGGFHVLALDTFGVMYSWGDNYFGQLGSGMDITHSRVPLAVATSGVLSGKTVNKVVAGYIYSLATATSDDMTPPDVAVSSPEPDRIFGP